MKIQHVVLISVLLSGSGVALAAGSGTGGSAEGGPGNNAAIAASGSMSSKTHSTKMKTKKKHTAAKPMNDSTNTPPGPNAGSDTKGH